MNALVSVSYEDRLKAEHKARQQRLHGRPKVVNIAPELRKAREEPKPKPEPVALPVEQPYDAHVLAYRQYQADCFKVFGSPIRTYIHKRAMELGVTFSEIMAPGRMQPGLAARQLIMWEIKTQVRPDITLPEIGRIFDRDHTTVLHAIRKIEALKAAEAE